MSLETNSLSTNSVDFSVVDGGDLLCEMYGPEGPRPSAVLADGLALDLAADTARMYVYIMQAPTFPPEWWDADADALFMALDCCGAVDVDVRPGHPGNEGLVVREAPGGRVEVTLVRQSHRMNVVARECVLVDFRATQIRKGCGCG